MSSENVGRPSNEDIHKRREAVKEMMLKEVSHADMARDLKVSINTIQSDVKYWNDYFTKLAMNNPQIAERQIAKIEKLIGEIGLVKRNYWGIYQELLEKVEENKRIVAQWEARTTELRKQLDEAVARNDGKEKRRLEKELKEASRPMKLPSYYTNRLDTLKAILDRIDKEAKLLNLFNPATNLQKNYVSLETMKHVMIVFKNIITDMIPEEQRKYAFDRLRKVQVQDYKTEDILDAEVVVSSEEKIGFNKVDAPKETIQPPSQPEAPREEKQDGDETLDNLDI